MRSKISQRQSYSLDSIRVKQRNERLVSTFGRKYQQVFEQIQSSKQVWARSSVDSLLANGIQTIYLLHTVRTAADNHSCFNSTTTTSLHSKQTKLNTQFVIIQIIVQHLEVDAIFLQLMTQTSIPIHMPILVIAIKMLYTFVVMLIHGIDFQELITLWSRITKSGRLPLNDKIHCFILFIHLLPQICSNFLQFQLRERMKRFGFKLQSKHCNFWVYNHK